MGFFDRLFSRRQKQHESTPVRAPQPSTTKASSSPVDVKRSTGNEVLVETILGNGSNRSKLDAMRLLQKAGDARLADILSRVYIYELQFVSASGLRRAGGLHSEK